MSIKNKLYLGSVILLLASLLIVFSIVQFAVTPTIKNNAIANAQLAAKGIGENISTQLQENAILTRSLATLAESLPLEQSNFIDHIGSLVESGKGIAGGGIWPEPNQFIAGKDKASLFWAKTAPGKFELLDDYNAADSSPYQAEPWYTSVKNAQSGQCMWSEIYVDPVSNVAMATCSVKIERNNQFWGVATIDVELSDLSQKLTDYDKSTGSFGIIVDQADQIVSMPLLRNQDFTLVTLNELGSKDPSLAPLAKQLLTHTNTGATEFSAGVVKGDESVLVSYTLPNQQWKVAILVPSTIALASTKAITITLYTAFIGLIVVFILALIIWGNRLITIIKRTTEQVIALTQGNTSTKLAVVGNDELAKLAEAINHYGDHLTTVLLQVKDEAEHVKNNANAMDSLSAAAQQRALQLMDENNTLATAINEMSATAGSVSQDVSTVADITNSSAELVNSGFSLIEQNTDAISALFDKLEESVTVISQLSQDSQQVGTVLDVIMNISDQTNLLALNAAIEAARAGESGRGFAVVADEVRTLAHRTQQSAAEIETMIKQLQDASARGVKVIEECRGFSETANDRSNATRSQYEQIVDSFNDIRERAHSIATATEEQAQVTDNVERLAERIREISTQNVDDAGQFRSVSSEATDQAHRLYDISRQ